MRGVVAGWGDDGNSSIVDGLPRMHKAWVSDFSTTEEKGERPCALSGLGGREGSEVVNG